MQQKVCPNIFLVISAITCKFDSQFYLHFVTYNSRMAVLSLFGLLTVFQSYV